MVHGFESSQAESHSATLFPWILWNESKQNCPGCASLNPNQISALQLTSPAVAFSLALYAWWILLWHHTKFLILAACLEAVLWPIGQPASRPQPIYCQTNDPLMSCSHFFELTGSVLKLLLPADLHINHALFNLTQVNAKSGLEVRVKNQTHYLLTTVAPGNGERELNRCPISWNSQCVANKFDVFSLCKHSSQCKISDLMVKIKSNQSNELTSLPLVDSSCRSMDRPM